MLLIHENLPTILYDTRCHLCLLSLWLLHMYASWAGPIYMCNGLGSNMYIQLGLLDWNINVGLGPLLDCMRYFRELSKNCDYDLSWNVSGTSCGKGKGTTWLKCFTLYYYDSYFDDVNPRWLSFEKELMLFPIFKKEKFDLKFGTL